MENIIIGTAGHVDHGKTQLIKALSGIDTDRLEEEKKRGITIELGFAHIPNDAGYNIGVIDVPGHEKFIKNMLAGIGGIDFVLFVIAADEGIMPQTREHFEILKSLGINDGIIVITKIDMVDAEWLEMLGEDIKDYFRGSFLDEKPVITVSSRTGENIEALRSEIIKKCNRNSGRNVDPAMFRLPVDRVFTMAGYGTVVTGTLVEGECSVGDDIMIYPEGRKVRVRGIQTYGEDVDRAVAGQRTAINLAGIEKSDISRGDVLAREGAVVVTSMIDVKLDVFKSSDRSVINNSRVHIYQGSKEALCKVILMDRDVLMPGDSAYAQLRIEEPIAIKRGDRFIIRFYSPVITIGGGVVLDASPDKHKRNRDDVIGHLDVMANGDLPDVVIEKATGRRLYTGQDIAMELGVSDDDVACVIDGLLSKGALLRAGDFLVGENRFSALLDEFTGIMNRYHEDNPLASGMPKRELISRLKDAWHIDDENVITSLIELLLSKGYAADAGREIALAGFTIEHTEEQDELKREISDMYAHAGIEMIKNDEIEALCKDKKTAAALLSELVSDGVIVKVDQAYHISVEGWNRVISAAESMDGDFSLAEYRDKLGTSRKYAEVFLRALDKAGVTVFDGSKRHVIR